jgi:hypothetical protein
MRIAALTLAGLVALALAVDSAQAGDGPRHAAQVTLTAHHGPSGPAVIHEVRNYGHSSRGSYGHSSRGSYGHSSRGSYGHGSSGQYGHHDRHSGHGYQGYQGYSYRYYRPYPTYPPVVVPVPVRPPYYQPYPYHGLQYRSPSISFGIGF